MIEWIKNLFYNKPYCKCEPHIDFSPIVIKKDQYHKETKYKCNKCGFIHQYWLFDGGIVYINPALKNYVYQNAKVKLFK